MIIGTFAGLMSAVLTFALALVLQAADLVLVYLAELANLLRATGQKLAALMGRRPPEK